MRTQLYVAHDLQYVTEEQLRQALEEAEMVSKKLYHFIEAVKSSTYKGLKYKRAKGTAWNDLLRKLKQDQPDLNIEPFLNP